MSGSSCIKPFMALLLVLRALAPAPCRQAADPALAGTSLQHGTRRRHVTGPTAALPASGLRRIYGARMRGGAGRRHAPAAARRPARPAAAARARRPSAEPAPVLPPPCRLSTLLGIIGVLIVASNVGTILSATLVNDHPVALIALSARIRHLLLAVAAGIDPVPYFLVGFVRLLVPAVAFYLLGRWYGDVGLRWLETPGRRACPRRIRWVEKAFVRVKEPIVMLMPGSNLVCLLAGTSKMTPRRVRRARRDRHRRAPRGVLVPRQGARGAARRRARLDPALPVVDRRRLRRPHVRPELPEGVGAAAPSQGSRGRRSPFGPGSVTR